MARLVTRGRGVRRHWLAASLWALFFIAYNANGREIPTADSQAAKFAAVMLVRHHTLTLDGIVGRQPGYAERQAFAKDVNGHWRSAYPLPPVIEAAVVAVLLRSVGALHLDGRGAPAVVAKLSASIVASLAGLLAFLTARRFTNPLGAALVAIGFALGTGMWPIASQTLWQHATAICASMAAVWLWSATDRHGFGRMLAIGLLLGWSWSARPQTTPMIAVLLIGVMQATSGPRRVAGILGFLAPVAVFMALNVVWFGSPRGAFPDIGSLNQSIHAVTSTWQEPLAGLAGLLFSPSRGLLIFSPIALLPLAARRVPPERRTLVYWTLGAAAAQLLFYASYSVWWGGFTYGPRYLLDILPALVPAAAVGASRLGESSRIVRAAAGAALGWSILAAATGAFCFPHDNWNTDPVSVDRAHERLWEIRDSQIPRCWSHGLSPQNFALFERVAWRRDE